MNFTSLFHRSDGRKKLPCFTLNGAIYITVEIDGTKQMLVIPHPASRVECSEVVLKVAAAG